MENNSIDIYEEYFADNNLNNEDDAQFKTVSVFRDYSELKRKILDLTWCLDGCKIAAAHTYSEVANSPLNPCFDSYVWDIENANFPYCVLTPTTQLSCVEYSPRDLELLIGGHDNGQIGVWDVRAGGHPQQLSPLQKSHKESISDIKWISSKTGLEFFSGSTDGKLICWDARNISSPTQVMYFDQKLGDQSNENKSYSITCLEYDPTLPHRFMMGTEQGVMLSCNRKFKEPAEMISSCYYTQSGPVLRIERNAFLPKLFASCDAFGVKIWSEDLTKSPMLNLISQDGYVADVAWSTSHASFLFVCKTTGNFELWDILIKNHEPIISFKLETDGLICICPKQMGDQVACGTAIGCIHLLQVPQYQTSTLKHEKNLVAAMIDREAKREKILEGKTREQRIREEFPAEQLEAKEVTEPAAQSKFSADDKIENAEYESAEFVSQFDSDSNEADDDVGENDFHEITFMDIQFKDTVRAALNTEE
ncbi:dynein intermediate chain 2, axonemal-like isoform X1 [Stegodyphus dumicola]|nr:dynein intermediate chain 2, axonemal-like isoform X1 [Stegodyphus dumicola]